MKIEDNEENQGNDQGSFGEMAFDPDFFNMDEQAEETVEDVEVEVEDNKGQDEKPEVNTEEDDSSDETKDNTPPSSDIKDDSSLVAVLGNDLYERGAISSFDKEEVNKIIAEKGEAEGARHIIMSEIEAAKVKAKEVYEGDTQEYLRLRDAGFNPEAATSNIVAKENLGAITEEVLSGDNGQQIIESLMTNLLQETTQLDSKGIKDYIEYKLSVSPDDGLTEAKNAKEQLLNIVHQKEQTFIQNQEQARKDQEIAIANQKEDLKKSIESSTEFIKDIPVSNMIKDKMYSILTESAGEIEGEPVNQLTLVRSKDPKTFDMKMAYALATGYFDSDKPWEKIMKTSQTKATSKLDDYLANKTPSLKTGQKPQEKAGEDDFDKWMKRYD